MKRILFLDHTAKLSGGERSLLLILEKLSGERFKTFLVTFEEGPLLAAAKKLGIDAFSIPMPRLVSERKRKSTGFLFLFLSFFALIPTVASVIRFARTNRINIIYTNSQKAHLIGLVVGLIAGIPVCWHFRDILRERLLKRLMCYAGALFAKSIISISHAVASQFKISGRGNDKVIVIYNALDIGNFEKEAKDTPVDLRREFNLAKETMLIASVGQIAEWKGQEYFLRAARELALKYDGASFFIVGEPLFREQTYHSRLEALVGELRLEGRVFFTGFRSDIPAVMRDIDVLVHTPVEPEPFGRVLIEAMVCNTLVVAFDIGAVREIVTKHTGMLVTPHDVQGLVRAVSMLLEDGNLRERITAAARIYAKERFDYPPLMRKIEHLLTARGTEFVNL